MKKRLKILYTIPNFDTAGSGKVLYDLAKGINSSIFEVHIACSHNKGPFFEDVKKLDLPIHIIETTCTIRPYYSLLNRIQPYKKFIKEHHFDIVHSWHWSSDWSEVIGAKLGGAKFVYTKKAMSWGNVHWKIRSYLSDFIITINDEMKAYFPNRKNQRLIPLGIDANFYSPISEQNQANTSGQFKIITVANLVPVKGIEILIEALSLLENQSIELTVLGDDSTTYANELKVKVKNLNLEKQVVFLGKKLNIRPYLYNSDLYVIPTLNKGRKEGMPMALVEAMCLGVPVIGSNISGINFVLKEFKKLLFNAGDSLELARKIDSFIKMSLEDREAITSKLRSYTVKHFSMERFLNEHRDLYLSLVKKK